MGMSNIGGGGNTYVCCARWRFTFGRELAGRVTWFNWIFMYKLFGIYRVKMMAHCPLKPPISTGSVPGQHNASPTFGSQAEEESTDIVVHAGLFQ